MTAMGGGIAVPKPVTRPVRGLPAWTYENDELSALEYQRLVLPSWQIVCHESEIPKAGDYVTFDLQRDSILVIRDSEGTLRGFQNVCRHRGARMLDGKGACRGRIVCPYHGWNYDLQGRLRGVPSEDTFPGLDKASHGLLPVALDTLFGFVFVRVAGGGPSLAEMWAPFLKDLAPYRLDEVRRVGQVWTDEWHCDWKVAIDNNLENYHIPLGHPGYHRLLDAEMVGEFSDHGVTRSRAVLSETPSKNWVERLYQRLAPEVLTDMAPEYRRHWMFFHMLPNLGFDVYADSVDFFQILPLGPGRCQVRAAVYALPDSRREAKLLRYLNARINRKVAQEDQDLSERVQQGLRAHGYNPGPLSGYEVAVRQFHDLIRARIPAARLDEAPTPGTLVAADAELVAAAAQ
jgi:phenylpropionate dioxygenase-like ring-hydroxylating dioxygenase large terminal subunit